MLKEDILKDIAETGYNVGFGAKKNFATFDIVDKTPVLISLLVIGLGIFALVEESLNTKAVSASITILGIIGFYISLYAKRDYERHGKQLTELYNELATLYRKAKAIDNGSFENIESKLGDIKKRYYELSKSDQIFFSDWYAHYKFFWQHQIDWVNEQKQFKLFRDKVPLSFTVSVILAVILLVTFHFELAAALCRS